MSETPNPNQNNLEISSEFSKLTKVIEDGKKILTTTKQIPGVTQATLDEYTDILNKIEDYYNKTATTDTLLNINTKRTTFELETKKFVKKSTDDVEKKAILDAETIEKAKEPVNIPNKMTKTALDILYWILFTGFVLWAGSAGANLAFQLYNHNGAYTLYYFIYTGGLAAAYSLAVSWGIPYLTSYKESRFIRFICLILFQALCLGMFFTTTVSKELVFRAWLLPLMEGGKGLFSYEGAVMPLSTPGVLPPAGVTTPKVRTEPSGVSALLGAAAVTKNVGDVFSRPA